MDTPTKPPNILHLQGITLDDFVPIEDVFDTKILEASDTEGTCSEPFIRDKIPMIFTSLEDWPSTTSLQCWSCVFSFDSPPCFIPTFVRQGAKSENSVEMGVLGNFCTFNCAARYIDDTFPPQAFAQKHWRMHDNLRLVYHHFTQHRIAHIKPSPPKTERLEFGGSLSKDEFWDQLRELDPRYGLRDHRPGTVVPDRLRSPSLKTSVWEIFKDTEAVSLKCTPKSNPSPLPSHNTSLAETKTSDEMIKQFDEPETTEKSAVADKSETTEKSAVADKSENTEKSAAANLVVVGDEVINLDQILEDLYNI